jgi:hypothetical protein
VRAVLLDRAASGLQPGQEPGFLPVAQFCYLTGRYAPMAAGPAEPLKSPSDPATDRPRREQAAVELLLHALRESPAPAFVTVLGSARIVTAAYNRDPALLKRKIKSVLVNAGSSGDDAAEYNVVIDVPAYVGLFRSGLPIDWYPCAAPGPDKSVALNAGDRNTFWLATHEALLQGIPEPLFAWFVYSFTGSSRADLLRALRESRGYASTMVWQGSRNMWSTASLALAAGRALAKTPEGWRFVPAAGLRPGTVTMPLSLDPVDVMVSGSGHTKWKPAAGASNIRLFRREAGAAHDAAMAEALNALLRSLPVDPL